MRRVSVGGREFTIPDDQIYVVRNEEMRQFDRTQVTTEFLFHPHPHNYVSIRTCERDVSSLHMSAANESIPVADNWVDQPPRDLVDFLLVDPPSENPCATAYYPSNYDHKQPYQRHVFHEKYKTAPGRTPSNGPARKSAVLPKHMYDPDRMDDRLRGLNSADQASMLERMERIKRGVKRRPMANKFTSGTRVMFRHPIGKKMSYATVVGVVDEMKGNERPGTILLCTDESYTGFKYHENYTGENRGLMVNCKKAEVDGVMGDTWHTVPENVGVCARKEFGHDGVTFPAGCTGRIIGPPDMEQGLILISWNFSNDNFHSHEDSGGGLWNQCWQVPLSKVSMCLLNYEKRVLSHWPAGMGNKPTSRKKEDICIVIGRTATYVNQETGREQRLPDGTVVELLKNNGGSTRTWTCKIIGGCPDSMVGESTNISERYLNNHPHPERFYRPGEVVEIVAKVDFRKVALQGMKGKVILSTDTDGDVGIEFKEDIGAGSLDGIGKEGHCIYIEANLVKSSE